MIAGICGAAQDVIPYGFVLGNPRGVLVGLNVVGLRRRGASRADMHRLRRAYRLLFLGEGHFAERLEAVAEEYAGDPDRRQDRGFHSRARIAAVDEGAGPACRSGDARGAAS